MLAQDGIPQARGYPTHCAVIPHPLAIVGSKLLPIAALLWLLLCPDPRAFAQEPIVSKILVFAQTNHARVQCMLNPTADPTPVDLDAAIVDKDSGEVLWRGSLGSIARDPTHEVMVESVIDRIAPKLWEPGAPHLYDLNVTARLQETVLGQATTRFGFRTFTASHGQFHLNGKPVFLRGVAINPPNRTIPNEIAESREFAENYVRFLKTKNVNILRISIDSSQTWFDVCDELGMMLYAGRYGAPPGTDAKKGPPEDFEVGIAAYRQLFETFVNHPSIVIYCLANELPVTGQRSADFHAFLTEACEQLKAWDPTRPIIANAGYGEGREGDICDVHRYWGWYYNSFLTYYNLRDSLRDQPLFGPGKNQPLTFTECVGAFTGSLGEFNLVRSKQLAPRLGWIGSTEHPVEDSLAYQARLVKEATESFRRMRPLNHRLAGIMPFTIFFYNWSGIDSFEEMEPKPAMEQLGVSYQPILLSWELWTSQVYAGTRIRPVVHVVNDADSGRPLTNAFLQYALIHKNGTNLLTGEVRVPDVPHYGAWSEELPITVPRSLLTGEYFLTGVVHQYGLTMSSNWTEIFIAERAWGHPPVKPKSIAHVYDRSGRTPAALAASGISTKPLKEINNSLKRVRTLIIGENAWDSHLTEHRAELREFVRNGGRLVCLQQQFARFPTDWLPTKIVRLQSSANDPAYPPTTRPHREQSHLNMLRPSHPIFLGLDRKRLALWSDYTRWRQARPGFPRVYPVTSGFRLLQPEDLAHTAILADYDRGLEGVALCEMFDGNGSILFSGLDLVNRANLDPVADRFLANIVFYATDEQPHDPLVTPNRPIIWGDLPSEQGLIHGSLNELILNAEWVRGPTQSEEQALPANTGSWNMMPGDQFVPRGRNPFGPYTYSTASTLRSGPKESVGSGFFFVRRPEGATRISTTARNPGKQPALLRMTVNGQTTEATLPPGQQATLGLNLPQDSHLRVGFTGPKDVVLQETTFE